MVDNYDTSAYPGQIDGYSTLPLVRNGIDEIKAQDHNRLRDAIVKIESELGITPSGTYGTVAERLDNIGDAMSAIAAHVADTVGAHEASAISIEDSSDYFAQNNVEGVIEELALLLPIRPDYVGGDIEDRPNTGVPSFADGYGTKFLFQVTNGKTQPYSITGIAILEVSSQTPSGQGTLSYVKTLNQLKWKAPGDSAFGTPVDIISAPASFIVRSSTTTKAILCTRTNASLPALNTSENFQVYDMSAKHAYYTKQGEGMLETDFAVLNANGTSTHQFVISGMVSPADKGVLVLQKAIQGGEFYPISVLNLGSAPISVEPCAGFIEGSRSTGQLNYFPTFGVSNTYDNILLYDRLPVKKQYVSFWYNDVNGDPPYENFSLDYNSYQLAKYIIPISNPSIIGGTLTSPSDILEAAVTNAVCSYRLVHFKPGETDYFGDPAQEDIYSVLDYSGEGEDNEVKFSDLYVDQNNSIGRTITSISVRPASPNSFTAKTLSGVRYYSSSTSNRFDFDVQSDDTMFYQTYVQNDALRFTTNVFDFPSGTSTAKYGADVDLFEMQDSSDTFFSSSSEPGFDETAKYIVDNSGLYPEDRRLSPAENSFSTLAYITAKLYGPFGPGAEATATGAETLFGSSRSRILVNSYDSRSTVTKEYFTDEDYRIGAAEDFGFHTDASKYTEADGVHADLSRTLVAFSSGAALDTSSLQCGSLLNPNDTCGLIYPQHNYGSGIMLPFQLGENFVDPTYTAPTLPNYATYPNSDKYYQRLFSLEYPTNGGRLRVISGGSSLVSLNDVSYYNASRFGKIEVKVPGRLPGETTGWLDISRYYEIGYEDEDGRGALIGLPTGTAGDFTVNFTFGRINNASSGNMIAVRITYFGDTEPESTASKSRIITSVELLAPTF